MVYKKGMGFNRKQFKKNLKTKDWDKRKKFQRRVEDFVCGNCGQMVEGGGYTDHCPKCLWSKHVDINPGDRRSECGGLMKPVGAEIKGKNFIIYYRCLKCGFKHRVKSAAGDNLKKIIELTSQPINIT